MPRTCALMNKGNSDERRSRTSVRQPTLLLGHPQITEYRWQLEADLYRHRGLLPATGSKAGLREAD